MKTILTASKILLGICGALFLACVLHGFVSGTPLPQAPAPHANAARP